MSRHARVLWKMQCCTNTWVSMIAWCLPSPRPQGQPRGLEMEDYPGWLLIDVLPHSCRHWHLPSARCLVVRTWSLWALEGPCPMLLAAGISDRVPGGMYVPALSPAPAPEVTPAGSRLVPVFPLHVAPCLVSTYVRRPESQLLTCPPMLGTVGKCPAFSVPWRPHMLAKDLSEKFYMSGFNL